MTKDELDKYKELEFAVEKLVDYCNNTEGMATACEVIAVEAALERLYKARQKESKKDMTKADIISIAREAGMGGMLTDVVCTHAELERFAQLVAAKERKACAALCRKEVAETDKHLSIVIEALEDCAYLIEKRGGK